ncbi:MAG: hypothetical protein EOM10_13520 [Opitutae bacterium]|nr:hypothetical protein [Opitutae bacterium]
MAIAVQRRRGSTADHAAFTGLAGEITVDTSKQVVVVHDGATAGGFPAAAEDHAHAGLYEPVDETLLRAANIGTGPGAVAAGDHAHAGVYEPVDATLLRSSDIGTGSGNVAAGDHAHAGVYEPADESILKATDIGTESGTIAAGNHNHGGDAASLGSGAAVAGRVLMANGSGGAAWEVVSVITVSATAPANPVLNDLWLDIS